MFITNTICSTPADGSSSQALEDLRENKQLFKLLVWLTVLFCICTLPTSLFFIYLSATGKPTVDENRDLLFVAHRIVRFLLNANSFFKPLVYAFQSSNYQKGFKRIFCTKNSSEMNE